MHLNNFYTYFVRIFVQTYFIQNWIFCICINNNGLVQQIPIYGLIFYFLLFGMWLMNVLKFEIFSWYLKMLNFSLVLLCQLKRILLWITRYCFKRIESLLKFRRTAVCHARFVIDRRNLHCPKLISHLS